MYGCRGATDTGACRLRDSLRCPDLVQQLGGPVQQLEQVDHRRHRLGLAQLVAGKSVGAAAGNLGGFLLGEFQLLADALQFRRLLGVDGVGEAHALAGIELHLAAMGAMPALYGSDDRLMAPALIRDIANLMAHFPVATIQTFPAHVFSAQLRGHQSLLVRHMYLERQGFFSLG